MLTQLRFIYNWFIVGIKWLVCWWVLVQFGQQWVTCTLEAHGLDVGLTMQYDGFVLCSLHSPVIPYLKWFSHGTFVLCCTFETSRAISYGGSSRIQWSKTVRWTVCIQKAYFCMDCIVHVQSLWQPIGYKCHSRCQYQTSNMTDKILEFWMVGTQNQGFKVKPCFSLNGMLEF
jgi:hypothetical protein